MTGDTTPDDGTDDPTELLDRIRQLERVVGRHGPTRRDALKAGLGALAGGALVAASSPTAAAATTYVETDELRTPGGATRVKIGSPVQVTNANLQMASGANIDASASDLATLPHRTSDPSASAGDLWYRTDLD
jgi:hypothetical protein